MDKLLYTADELRKRRKTYIEECERSLKERDDKLRKLCTPIVLKIIAEFNRKAENIFDDNAVTLDDTPIPHTLTLDRVVDILRETFESHGYEISVITDKRKRNCIKVTW